jgi:hypothetical protein
MLEDWNNYAEEVALENEKKQMVATEVSVNKIYAIKQFGGSQESPYTLDSKVALGEFKNDPDNYISLVESKVDGYYYIMSQTTNKEVWDVKGGNTEDGSILCRYEKKDGNNQLFKFIFAGHETGKANTYYIQSKSSGKYLCNVNGVIGIKDWSNGSYEDFAWELTPYSIVQKIQENQNFIIMNPQTGKAFNIAGKSGENNKNGQAIRLYELQYDVNSPYDLDVQFKFIPTIPKNEGWQSIECQNGGRLVDVPGDGSEKGRELQLWTPSKNGSEDFYFVAISDHTFLIGTNHNYAIDYNGEKLSVWGQHFGSNQQFELIYADGPMKNEVYKFQKLVR